MPAFQTLYKEPAGGRNAACPCGSGKKYKKCHEKPRGAAKEEKSRQQKLTFKFSQPIPITTSDTDQLSVKLDPWSKGIEVVSTGTVIAPSQVEIERSYARDKGPKVTNRATVDSAAPHFDFTRALSAYDLCIGVDTNTDKVHGEQVSVTGTSIFDPSQDFSKSVYAFPGFAFELRNVKAPPEKLGWILLIHNFMKSPRFDSAKRYCIVVDPYLNELPAINQRTQPILNDQMLPDQFDLVYASADAGNEMQNRLIKHADWCATAVHKLLEAGQQFSDLDRTPDCYSDARRMWDIQALVNNGILKLN